MGMTDIEKRALKGGTALPDLSKLPIRAPRVRLAEMVSQFYFQVSPRSMERWPLVWHRVNGKAHAETAQAFAVAQSMLDAAATVRGGHKPASQQRTK